METKTPPRQTPLYDHHVKAKALMVDFAGWHMPLHYGSQIQEHHAVRKNAGIFDVSHMGVVDIEGNEALRFLRWLLANDAAKLRDGDALYSCMLNDHGGVIDDLIVYRFSNTSFRLVINAGCRDKDMMWLQKNVVNFDIKLELRDDVCLLALQGPDAIAHLKNIFDETAYQKVNALKSFQFCAHPAGWASVGEGAHIHTPNPIIIARTGYTGESGVEMMCSADEAIRIWEKCMVAGIQPCGLGARDTLRLEAGYNLYGNDMTEKTSPLISNLSWTVSFKDESRDFIGKNALLAEKEKGIAEQLVGLILESKGVLRNHQKVKCRENYMGEITSGSFSPTLNKSIALARIPVLNATEAFVERRNEWLPVKIVKPRFL
jgi:aminomethyltransferase